jgi:copper homeostasis protein (lipoprotein)
MKTTLWMITTLLLFMVDSCNSNPTKQDNTTEETRTTTNEMPPDKSNARNSLDYYGTYFGVLPCADCEGIRTTLKLLPEQKYVCPIHTRGKNPKIFLNTGAPGHGKTTILPSHLAIVINPTSTR